MPILQTGLELILPPGQDRWVGVLVEEPDISTGTYSELADSGYARVAHDAWLWDSTDKAVENGALILFPAIVDAAVQISWWGIFDAASGGNLLAAGPFLKGVEKTPTPFDLGVGDEPAFLAGDLRLKAEC